MVTLQTADDVLKNFYLDAITDQLDGKISPFFSMVEKTSAYVTGKGISKVFRTGSANGVCAGDETGDLPKAREGEYLAANLPLKNLYGTIEISDKAIRASAGSEGAFVNLLNEEMKALLSSAKYNFSRMLFGDGSGRIGLVTNVSGADVTLDNVKGVQSGMYVDFYNGTTALQTNKRIKSVNKERKKVTIEGVSWNADTFPTNTYMLIHGTTLGGEISGLDSVFFYENIYGLPRNNELLKPHVLEDVGNFDGYLLETAIDAVEEAGGGKVNLILCTRGVRRAMREYFRTEGREFPEIEVNGEKVFAYNGIPVVVDDFCPEGRLYLLNTDDFKLCQLCDWQWMEGEDGKILKQLPGKPVYTATLVKYAELLCEKPCGQGLLTGVTEE